MWVKLMHVNRKTQTSKPEQEIPIGTTEFPTDNPQVPLHDQIELGLKRTKILAFLVILAVHTKWDKLKFCDPQGIQSRKSGGKRETEAYQLANYISCWDTLQSPSSLPLAHESSSTSAPLQYMRYISGS
jgi:hypothetical protein